MIKPMINVCIFEDHLFTQLQPLTTLKPVYELSLGMGTLADLVAKQFDGYPLTLHCRPYLKSTLQYRHPNTSVNTLNTSVSCLFLNGRVVMTNALRDLCQSLDIAQNHLLVSNGEFVAALLNDDLLHYMKTALEAVPSSEALVTYLRNKCVTQNVEAVTMISHPWDLIQSLPAALHESIQNENTLGIIKGDMRPYVSFIDENKIYIGKQTKIEDFVVLDASKGPIYIDEQVTITTGSRLEGPLYLAKGVTVLGASLKCCSIGPHCKVGGEVSNSTFSAYSNKAHDGFMGHSYVGEWVNIGAGTITSNLKNTYGEISLTLDGQKCPTGSQFLGTMIGDHVKLGIGTRLNAGTLLGMGSILYGHHAHDAWVPPFTWGEATQYERVNIDKFFEVATRMMTRRNVELLDKEKEIMRFLYEND